MGPAGGRRPFSGQRRQGLNAAVQRLVRFCVMIVAAAYTQVGA
jgi:hypothetical protein